MAFAIQEQVDLSPYNSFGVRQFAAYFAAIQGASDRQQAREFAEREYSDGLFSIQEVTDRKVFVSPRTHAVSNGRS